MSALVEHNALELVVQRLGQLDESSDEEARGIFNMLALLENMVDVMPEVAEMVLEKTRVCSELLWQLNMSTGLAMPLVLFK